MTNEIKETPNYYKIHLGILDKELKKQKRVFLEKLNEWRYKDHNPEQNCQCQKCQHYREIVELIK